MLFGLVMIYLDLGRKAVIIKPIKVLRQTTLSRSAVNIIKYYVCNECTLLLNGQEHSAPRLNDYSTTFGACILSLKLEEHCKWRVRSV